MTMTKMLHILLLISSGMLASASDRWVCAGTDNTGSMCESADSWIMSTQDEDEMHNLQLLQVKQQKSAAPACGILWFYHVPKTGGMSVRQWLLETKALGAIQDVLELKVEKPYEDDYINFTAFQEQQIQPALHNIKGKLVAVHHHHKGPGLYGMEHYFSDLKKQLSSQGCSLTRFTVLREPVSLLMSALRYDSQLRNGNSSLKSGNNETKHNRSLRQNCRWHLKSGDQESIRRDNAEVRYILNNFGSGDFPMPFGGSKDAALKAAIQILDSFEVVGLTEELDLSIRNLVQVLRLPVFAEIPHMNERGHWYQVQEDEIQEFPDDLRDLIKRRSKYDVQMYERFASKFPRNN
mmetsp:Transcript_2881/g.5342  ORF Transcript_2881/g.5342 Transcript_2881/m.5342 type:complete len:350 (-) Transcript_2881:41-1090(-)